MRRKFLLAVLGACVAGAASRAMTTAERRDVLNWMTQTLPDVPAWNEWQKKPASCPPDFDALPRSNALPDPFRFLDGRSVKTEADWRRALPKSDDSSRNGISVRFAEPKLDNVVPVDEEREATGT